MTANFTIERLKAEHYDELMAMLLAAFRTVRPDIPDFDKMFPDAYRPTDDAMGCNYAIRQRGKIVACVGLFPVPLHLGGQSVRVAGIGGVATLPECRGQGLMQVLLDHAHRQIIDHGYALSMLGGDRRRYRPWGYEMVINQFQLTLDPRAPGLSDYQGILAQPPVEQPVDDPLWPVLWAQAAPDPALAACGRDTLKLKYQRINQKAIALPGPDGGHVLMYEDNDRRALCAWAGEPRVVGALVAQKLALGKTIDVVVPWKRDAYAQVFHDLALTGQMVRGSSLAITDLEKTLNLYQPHIAQQVSKYNLKGRTRLVMQAAPNLPAQQVLLEADGNSIAITNPAGVTAPTLELSRWQLVEIFFTPCAADNLPPQAQWLTPLLPLPFFRLPIYGV